MTCNFHMHHWQFPQIAVCQATATCSIIFTLKERPAVMEETADISFGGKIREGAEHCFVSFPGKFASAWDALIDEDAVHAQSIACVFLCTPEDGLGRHEPDPARPGACYCKTIYGERSYEEFGYLNILPKDCTPDQEMKAKTIAKFTKTVVVRGDASEEERGAAREKAFQAWEENGRVAPWGCQWFQVWKKKVEEAVRLRQTLKVVFFPGQVGQGKEAWRDLATADLWNGIGCGGSQKGEIAYLDMMRDKFPGQGWDYDDVDVVSFMVKEFKENSVVNALCKDDYGDGSQWCKGKLLAEPTLEERPKLSDPKRRERVLQCKVRSEVNGKVFTTDRVRHGDAIQKLLDSVGKNNFLEMVQGIFPKDVKFVDFKGSTLPNGSDCFRVEVRVETASAMQALRNAVLNQDLEIAINKKLLSNHGRWQLHLDKTHFCKSYEQELLGISKLTVHQRAKYEEIKAAKTWSKDVHVSAVAGTGKSFIAVQLMIDAMQSSSEKLLFVAPSLSLCLHFARWLWRSWGRRSGLEKFDIVLKRLFFMHEPYSCLRSCRITGGSIQLVPVQNEGFIQSFLLQVVDEAQDVFFNNAQHMLLESISSTCHSRLFLSSQCQCASVPRGLFPSIPTVQLTEVIRSTQRIVAGAAAFHSAASVQQDVKSVCPSGPPVKTYIFNSPENSDAYGIYAQKTVAAIWHVVSGYAGLSLNHRLALLVPNGDFLKRFKPLLGEALNEHFTGRHFELVSFEESLSILPPDLLGIAVDGDDYGKTEAIILDHMENSKGLESLIVMCIALDEQVEATQAEAATTRARLYRGITRAQVQAIVINEQIPGGWLEFLGFLKFEPVKFEESKALQETKAEAAAEVIAARPESHPKEDAVLPTTLSKDVERETQKDESNVSTFCTMTRCVGHWKQPQKRWYSWI